MPQECHKPARGRTKPTSGNLRGRTLATSPRLLRRLAAKAANKAWEKGRASGITCANLPALPQRACAFAKLVVLVEHVANSKARDNKDWMKAAETVMVQVPGAPLRNRTPIQLCPSPSDT